MGREMNEELLKGARQALREQQANEIARRYQQGYGKPIIATVFQGYQVVAVGSRLKFGANWRFFTDFLIDHLKDEMGRDWAIQLQKEGRGHPIFDWLAALQEASVSNKAQGRRIFEAQSGGYLSALWRLAYALYLIEHHDQMDNKLIRRLRNSGTFSSALHESSVAAAFAISGHQLKMAEVVSTDRPVPEFWATTQTGKRFAVEAKCKDGWKNPASDKAAFLSELRQWIRDQIYRCSKKNLENAVYCLELSVDDDLSEEEWKAIYDEIQSYVAEAENITVKGKPAVPAYILISNNGDVLSNDRRKLRRTMMLFGYRMKLWIPHGARVDVEKAFDAHDAHREINFVLNCLQEIDEVPQTFDGTPLIVDELGNEVEIAVKIGSEIKYPDKEGVEKVGTVYDITSSGSSAYLAVESDGQHHIVSMPLSPEEQHAIEKYGDAVFGKPEKRRQNLGKDYLRFYDWNLETMADYGREGLLKQVQSHGNFKEIEKLEDGELLVRVAREITKAMMNSTGLLQEVQKDV